MTVNTAKLYSKTCAFLVAGAASLAVAQPAHALEDWRRTVIFVQAQTTTGQDMFLRGGLDHAQAATLGRVCTKENMSCAMPIRHRNQLNATTTPWKQADRHLDWYGAEPGQVGADGTAADWTTNLWPASFGPFRSVAVDGFGQEALNLWGHHYWMLDVDMDCSKTLNGWFELKTFVRNGQGWEGDIAQAGTPYVSKNHFARCGQINRFTINSSAALFLDLKWNEAEVDRGDGYKNIGTDGTKLILGKLLGNTVQVWEPISNGQWNKTTVVAPTGRNFDGAVDVSADAFVATSGVDTLVYKKLSGGWSLTSTLTGTSASTSYFRNASIDNGLIAIGRPTALGMGAVVNTYSTLSNGSAAHVMTIQSPASGDIASFGKEVVLSGNFLAVAADNAAYVYERGTNGFWTLVRSVNVPTTQKVTSLDLRVMSGGGPVVLAVAARGIPGTNSVYVHELNGGAWSLVNTLTSPSDSWTSFGRQVSVDKNGYLSFIVDGPLGAPRVDIYKRSTSGTWILAQGVSAAVPGSWPRFSSHMVMVNPDTILMSETIAGSGVLFKIQK